MKRRLLLPAIGLPLVLLAGSLMWNQASVPPKYMPPAAELIIRDSGCILQPGDSVTVAVAHNTMIGFAYLSRAAGSNTYTARFPGTPEFRLIYYIRIHAAKPFGVWVNRYQFTQPVLRINCPGGRKFGNITRPPWAQHPWPGGDD